MSFLSHYRKDVANGTLKPDPLQANAAEKP